MNRRIAFGWSAFLLAFGGLAVLSQPGGDPETEREVARLQRKAKEAKQGAEVVGQRLAPLQQDVKKLEEKLKSIDPPKLKSEAEEKVDIKTPEPPRQSGGSSSSSPPPKKDGAAEEWNLPFARAGKKQQNILVICQNNKAYFLDFDALKKAALKNTSIGTNTTLRPDRGDFDVSITYKTEGNIRYRTTTVVPKGGRSGDATETVLAADSHLMKRLADLDPKDNTLQFSVYPDSYEVFRKLRKFAYEKDYDVAWMPMAVDGKVFLGSGSATVQ